MTTMSEPRFWERLFPPNVDFFSILLQHAEAVHAGITALHSYLLTGSEEDGLTIRKKEKEADDYRRELRAAVLNSFSTPIDREDLFMLSRRLDEVINYAKHTLRDTQILEVRASGNLVAMAAVLAEGTKHIVEAIRRLPERDAACNHHARAAKNFENDVTKLYPVCLKELFQLDDLHEVLKQREILRNISLTADRLDEVADVVLQIVVKEA